MTLDEPEIDALTGGIYFGIVEGLRCADGTMQCAGSLSSSGAKALCASGDISSFDFDVEKERASVIVVANALSAWERTSESARFVVRKLNLVCYPTLVSCACSGMSIALKPRK